jgi:hypothetical protein
VLQLCFLEKWNCADKLSMITSFLLYRLWLRQKKSCQPAKILRGTGFTVHIVHMDPAFCLVMSCGHVLRDHTRGKVSVLFQRALITARVIFVMEIEKYGSS